MTDATQGAPDARVLDRVRKLMNKARDGAVTEAEAHAFAAKAAEIMETFGLEMAEIEAAGGEGEAREKREEASAFGAWYGPLMRAVAESCFCSAHVLEGSGRVWFTLVGRRSAVASTRVTYDYLRSAIWRLSGRAAREGSVTSARYFRHGCAERVVERLRERHERVLREQRERAEAERTARAGGAAPTAGALVVVLTDWERQEADLNEDFLRGKPPGTTAAQRAARVQRAAARERRLEELRAAGVDPAVAWDVAYLDKTLEEAEADRAARALGASKGRSDERRANERLHEQWERREQRRRNREELKRSSPSFRAGRQAGEQVGLDQQITAGGGTPRERQLKAGADQRARRG